MTCEAIANAHAYTKTHKVKALEKIVMQYDASNAFYDANTKLRSVSTYIHMYIHKYIFYVVL